MPPKVPDAPSYVLWEITRACNLRCDHCAARAGVHRRDELDTEEALALCDDLATLGTPAVCLMGGEPLVRADWKQLATRLAERRVAVGLISNGWALDDELVAELPSLGVVQVGISLDAADGERHDRMRGRKGAHDRALAAIRRIAALAIPYRTVITSVRRGNLSELPGIADWLCKNAEGCTWMVNIASPHKETRARRDEFLAPEQFEEIACFVSTYREKLRGRLNVTATHDLGYFSKRYPDLHDFDWQGCVAGIETLGIRSNGDVTGCLVLDDSFIEGNVRTQPLAELWRDPTAFSYNRGFDPSWLRGICAGCEQGAVCRGGCRDHAVSFTGDRFAYPFCLHNEEQGC